jgi:hypothetical protein
LPIIQYTVIYTVPHLLVKVIVVETMVPDM